MRYRQVASACCLAARDGGFGRLALGCGLGRVVVGLAQRAAGAAGRKPGIQAAGVESVTACEASHVVVVLKCIQANGACVAGLGQQFGRSSGADWVVLVVGVVMRVGGRFLPRLVVFPTPYSCQFLIVHLLVHCD